MKITAADINIIHNVLINVVTMLNKIMTLHSVYSLYYSGENVNMVRLVLPVLLHPKHSLHIHKCFGDALFRLDIERCNETRF